VASAVGAALLAFVAFVSAHVALGHVRPVRRRSLGIVVLFLAATAGAVTAVVMRGGGPIDALYALALMASGFILYMPPYYTIDNSVSVRTLLELETVPGGLTRDELLARYRFDWMVSRRLSDMVENGYLLEHAGRFTLTSRGRFVARVFSAVKTVGGLGAGG